MSYVWKGSLLKYWRESETSSTYIDGLCKLHVVEIEKKEKQGNIIQMQEIKYISNASDEVVNHASWNTAHS